GTPGTLSARHAFPQLWEAERTHGSLLRAQRAAARTAAGQPRGGIVSFRRGLHALPEALAARLPEGTLQLDTRIDALLPGTHSRWRLRPADPEAGPPGEFD